MIETQEKAEKYNTPFHMNDKPFCTKDDVGKEVILVRATQNLDVYRGYKKRIEKVGTKYVTADGLKFDVETGITLNKDGTTSMEPCIIWPDEVSRMYGDKLSIMGESKTPETKSEFISGCPEGRWKAEDALNCNFCLHGETCTKQLLMDDPDQLPEVFVTGEKAADFKMITEGDYCWYQNVEKPIHEEVSEKVAMMAMAAIEAKEKEDVKNRLRVERDATLKEKAYRNYKAQYANLKKEEKRLETKQEKLDEQLLLLREEIEEKADDAEIEKNAYIAYCQRHSLTPDVGIAGEQMTLNDFNKKINSGKATEKQDEEESEDDTEAEGSTLEDLRKQQIVKIAKDRSSEINAIKNIVLIENKKYKDEDHDEKDRAWKEMNSVVNDLIKNGFKPEREKVPDYYFTNWIIKVKINSDKP